MNVLIITETYPPIARANASLMKDLSLEFRNHGDKVFVITVVESDTRPKKRLQISNEEEITVVRVFFKKYKGINYVRRGILEEMMPYVVSKNAARALSNVTFDLIVTYSPPLNMYKVIRKFSSKQSIKFLFLRDIHPQTGVDLGIIKSKLVYTFYRVKEKRLYKMSDHIFVQLPSDREFLLNNNPYLSPQNVSVLFNFKRIQNHNDSQKANQRDYLKEFGLENKFILVYAGNLSEAQDAQKILQLAEELKSFPDIAVVIMGFGKDKEKLMKIRQQMGLTNVLILDPLPKEEYEAFLKMCHVGIIHLNGNFKTHNFPGKTLDYMYAGIPIIAKLNVGNDLERIIREANCGYVSSSGLDELKPKIISLYKDEDLRKSLGRNGRSYLEENLTSKRAYNEMSRVFNLIIELRRNEAQSNPVRNL